MALNYDYIDSYNKSVYMPKLRDQILSANPSMMRFFGKAKPKRGGTYIEVTPLWYKQNSNGGSYGKWDVATISFEDKVTKARWQWKYNRQFITLAHIDQLENAGEGEIVDILDSEMQIARESFKDDLGTQLFSLGTGNSGKDITGLQAAVDDSATVDTYGEIQRSTNTWWNAATSLNSGVDRAVTVDLMQSMWGTLTGYKDTSDKPTVIYTTQAIFDKYASIANVSVDRAENEMAKFGFTSLLFNGIPITVDSKCPAKHMYFINENHTYLVKHPDEDFKYVPFAWRTDQEVMVAKIRTANQLISDECRKSGVIKALDATL
jgi:hypothetical protein